MLRSAALCLLCSALLVRAAQLCARLGLAKPASLGSTGLGCALPGFALPASLGFA